MSPHYNCSYRNGPNEVRHYALHTFGCPWPHMVLCVRWMPRGGGYQDELTRIGLN